MERGLRAKTGVVDDARTYEEASAGNVIEIQTVSKVFSKLIVATLKNFALCRYYYRTVAVETEDGLKFESRCERFINEKAYIVGGDTLIMYETEEAKITSSYNFKHEIFETKEECQVLVNLYNSLGQEFLDYRLGLVLFLLKRNNPVYTKNAVLDNKGKMIDVWEHTD